eukprot:8102074-Prorocentrum_lima.AAC.1
MPLNGRIVTVGYPNGDITTGASTVVANIKFGFEYYQASPAAQTGFTFTLIEHVASFLSVAKSG